MVYNSSMIFLYIKTHNKTGFKYFGKTIQDPFKYKGSGTWWMRHLKKYGNDVSTEILGEYEDKEEAKKVAVEFSNRNNIVESKEWANLKIEELDGGFDHINNLPVEERVNVKTYREKLRKGEIKVGGTDHWNKESWDKAIENLKVNHDGKLWERLTEEQKEKRNNKISESNKVKNNSQFGTHIYLNEKLEKIPANEILNSNRFKEGKQPEGWITITEWKDRRKDKSNSAYGRHWYNDEEQNYYFYPEDPRIEILNLKRGRLTFSK